MKGDEISQSRYDNVILSPLVLRWLRLTLSYLISDSRDVHVFTQLHQGKVKEELEKFDYCLAYEIVEFVRKISVRVQGYTIKITHSITQTVAK